MWNPEKYTFLEFTVTYNTIIFNGDFRKGEKNTANRKQRRRSLQISI